MYGGHKSNLHVAYVGIEGHLKRRIEQHLIRRDSSVTTGTSVVSLNPELVTKSHWWEHQYFEEDSRLCAAEEIAFQVLDPVLRSLSRIAEEAKRLCMSNEFKAEMARLFKGDPSGEKQVLTLNHAFERL
jgi:hypothetical protein